MQGTKLCFSLYWTVILLFVNSIWLPQSWILCRCFHHYTPYILCHFVAHCTQTSEPQKNSRIIQQTWGEIYENHSDLVMYVVRCIAVKREYLRLMVLRFLSLTRLAGREKQRDKNCIYRLSLVPRRVCCHCHNSALMRLHTVLIFCVNLNASVVCFVKSYCICYISGCFWNKEIVIYKKCFFFVPTIAVSDHLWIC